MILSFAYQDLDTGWTLEETSFGSLNLLIGLSGVGKTRILRALLDVRKAALAGARGVPSARWRLVLEGGGERFVWQAETQVTRAETLRVGRQEDLYSDARFVSERIERGSEILVARNGGDFRFEEGRLPRLTESESAIELLGSEPAIHPLHEALRLWRSLELRESAGAIDTVAGVEASRRRLAGKLDLLRRDVSLDPLVKLYIAQQDHPEIFERITDDFIQVFPTVQELKIATYAELHVRPHLGEDFMANALALGLREEGVDGWVLHPQVSSGMAKTLTFLIETALAPKGAVFLIDELENSLGINCLPEVAGRMLEGLDRIQYLATSHHPRVINEIPFDRWKLVTRRGSTVRVLDASSVTSLRDASPLEKFTELINLPDYVEGVA